MTAAVGEPLAHAPIESSGTLVWRYDPWRERPRVALAASVAALGLCLFVVSLDEHPLLSLGLCLFCVSSFSPALTPVECRLDAEGVARRALLGWERRAWARIVRVVDLPSGVLVSPSIRPHWLDTQRGMTLPMPASERVRLTAEIRRRSGLHG